MIYDTLSNAALYYPLGSRFESGFNYLARFDPDTADGRVMLDGENLFAAVQSYRPTPAAQRPFEAHRAYVDLQFVALGEEAIFHSPLPKLRETVPYAAGEDAAFYSGDDDFPICMIPGTFAIFFPHDGHKPGCIWRSTGLVKKVVVKIRL
jgi:biofilm protein TabA